MYLVGPLEKEIWDPFESMLKIMGPLAERVRRSVPTENAAHLEV